MERAEMDWSLRIRRLFLRPDSNEKSLTWSLSKGKRTLRIELVVARLDTGPEVVHHKSDERGTLGFCIREDR